MQRDKSTGDARRARAAIGLDHVAIDLDGAFAQCFQIHHRAQGAPDQALDFLCATGLLAARRFAVHPAAGGARQHAVFRRHPALTLAAQKRRHFFVDAGGADDLGVAALDQHRAFGMLGVIAGNG